MVETFWYLETHADSAPPAAEKVLPTATFEFVLSLCDDVVQVLDPRRPSDPLTFSGAMACGPHSRYFLLPARRHGRALGVHFKPGGAWPLLPSHASRYANGFCNLTDILGFEISALRTRLATLTSLDDVFEQLEVFLAERINAERQVSPAVSSYLALLSKDPFSNPLAAVRQRFSITPKSLNDVFKRQVGLSPKKVARVVRFQDVLRQLQSDSPPHLGNLAARCGYFDQAHFNRDFRAFAGLTPSGYLTRRSRNMLHVQTEPAGDG